MVKSLINASLARGRRCLGWGVGPAAGSQGERQDSRGAVGLEVLEGRCLLSAVSFAVIGDFGQAGPAEAQVARRVKSWKPAFIATTGDNNYPDGAAATIDRNIGRYFQGYIGKYKGAYGPGSSRGNRFFPTLGNHDYRTDDARPYLDYFTLPNNERYYTVRRGPVQIFAINSEPQEPDGTSRTSRQALWLRGRLAASNAPWKIVLMHRPPYSSGWSHGPSPVMRWPFAAWGADAVIAGHEHNYERIGRNRVVYFVNGLGGRSLYGFGAPVAGSRVRYNGDYGAMKVDATNTSVTFRFITRTGEVIDTHTIRVARGAAARAAAPSPRSVASVFSTDPIRV